MTFLKFLFAVLFFGLFTACDPARTLVIRAADNANTSVTVFGNKNMLPYPDETAGEKVVIKIPSAENNAQRDTAFRYGLGGWEKKHQIPQLAADIDSIIITNSSGTLILKSKQELTTYLLAHRSGQSGCVITIEAK